MRDTIDDFQKTSNWPWFRFIRIQTKRDPPVDGSEIPSHARGKNEWGSFEVHSKDEYLSFDVLRFGMCENYQVVLSK